VHLPFLDRKEERSRLERLFARREGSLGVLYGRRRCGKSRLLREALPSASVINYVGDDREGTLQRASLAREVDRVIPGFARVRYPDWDALLARFWNEARPGAVLVLDEFPALVSAARELPSLLQKHVDRESSRGIHIVLSGSSQRMMQGLVLDRTAPLFGRAVEILRVAPLLAGWIQPALHLRDPIEAVRAFAVWGGIPRYWELAADLPDLETAVARLALSPLGVLYDEPTTLLLDDTRDTAQAASLLSLIGQGCHRLSEIAGRLGKPATSLSRPLQRLIELDLIRREVPFGFPPRSAKRTRYQIADPFLRFWFRFVEPNRSRLEAGRLTAVSRDMKRDFAHHVSGVWEELARASAPRLDIFGERLGPASRWWGAGVDQKPLELDIVAESEDRKSLLLGEVEWAEQIDAVRLAAELRRKAENLPFRQGRNVRLALWTKRAVRVPRDLKVLTPRQVLAALR
jgi:AAA+ ATPase superfamily predicted ATPase